MSKLVAAKVRRTYTRFPKGNHMQEVTEYLVRARQCREMIERALPGQRQALEELALTWEKLAEARKRSVQSDSQPSGAEGTSNL